MLKLSAEAGYRESKFFSVFGHCAPGNIVAFLCEGVADGLVAQRRMLIFGVNQRSYHVKNLMR